MGWLAVGMSGDDFDGVAVGVGDGGEVGAGGGVARSAEDGHAGGLQPLDEGIDGVFAADGEGYVDVAVVRNGGLSDGLAAGLVR